MSDSKNKTLKIAASFPHCCDECGGKLYYLGAGAFECRRCEKILYSDYGKVRKYIEENGMATILELELHTGVSREILEEFELEGTLYDPYEEINKCHHCGCVIEKGRYCKDCQGNIVGRLKEALTPEPEETEAAKAGSVKKKNNRMHYLKNE